MNNSRPLVSICIPTYNSADYLRECLDSIVAQTYKNVEVIISDNASSDNTVSIVKEYVVRNGFKLFQNATNIGPIANGNRLISLAKGGYIAIYHSDDVYEKTIVEESVSVLDSDENIGMVGTLGNIINDEGRRCNELRLPRHLKKLNKTIYIFDEALSAITKRGWFFVTPSIMVRKNVYDKLGVFELDRFRSANDYEMWLRIAKKYNVGILDRKLINYRVHKKQGTQLNIRKNAEVADIVLVLQEYKKKTTNEKLKKWCDDRININIIYAARRQNYYGLYNKSNETLKTLRSKQIRFLIQKYIIRLFNALDISIKKRTL